MFIQAVVPAFVNFRLFQYASFSEPITLKDSGGVPLDVTNCTARMQIRREMTDTVPVFTLTTENGGITMGNTDGKMTLNIGFDDTDVAIDVDGELWYHDLLLKSADGDTVQRTFQGTVAVYAGCTKPA